MEKLRETLNPEGRLKAFARPAPGLTAKRQYPLHSQECGQLYYVDADHRSFAGLEGDATETRFRCEDCLDLFKHDAYRAWLVEML
jgi:hypothetical protein